MPKHDGSVGLQMNSSNVCHQSWHQAAHPVCKQRDACCDNLDVYLKLGFDMSQLILQA